MVTIYDAPADEVISALADRLQDEISEPEWATYVKSGSGNEFPPDQPDFWYARAASILRRVAIDGPVGVERLTTVYGNKKEGSTRYGVAPNHRTDGSDKIVRTILQQLEDAGFVRDSPGENGRIVTADGQRFLDSTAGSVLEKIDRPDLERYI